MPIYDSGRKDHGRRSPSSSEMKCSTRKHLAPYGLEEVELQHEGRKLDAAGSLYVSLTKYKAVDPATPTTLPPGDKRSLPVENRIKDALERDQDESGEGESMEETLSEAGEMELGITPDEGAVAGNLSPDTTRELPQDLSGDD